MKRVVASMLLCLCIMTVIVYANSGLMALSARPKTEPYVVSQDTYIVVDEEKLTLDFSSNTKGYDVIGDVTATYKMTNQSDEFVSVKMAFPFIGKLSDKQRGVTVSLKGATEILSETQLSYSQYLCGLSRDFISEYSKDGIYNFSDILSAIPIEEYTPKHYQLTDKGKLYRFNIQPKTKDKTLIKLNVTYDPKASNVLPSGFFDYVINDTNATATTVCHDGDSQEVWFYVIGDDVEYSLEAYSDVGNSKAYADIETTIEYIQLSDYIVAGMKYRYNMQESNELWRKLYAFNLKNLDDILYKHGLLVDRHILPLDGLYMHAIVYTVDFEPNSEREVSVSYKAECSWSDLKAQNTQYFFEYLLSPAKTWAQFSNLYIEVIPPEQAPYILESSIKLTRAAEGIYTAFLETLPDSELKLTFYESEFVTIFDWLVGGMKAQFGYLYQIVLAVIVILVIISAVLITFFIFSRLPR